MTIRKVADLAVLLVVLGGGFALHRKDKAFQAPRPPRSEVAGVVEANNKLALACGRRLAGGRDNLIFSPFSLSASLAMIYEGARGRTAEEIRAAFPLPADAGLRRAQFAVISRELDKKPALRLPEFIGRLGPEYAEAVREFNKAGGQYELRSANALWTDRGNDFSVAFAELINKHYAGQAEALDLAGDPAGAAARINSWSESRTGGRIKGAAGALAPFRKGGLLITNALYFKGEWEKKFDRNRTRVEDFTLDGGGRVKAQMMSTESEGLNYASDAEMQMVELPYKGKAVSMLLVLPGGQNRPGPRESYYHGKFDGLHKRQGLPALMESPYHGKFDALRRHQGLPALMESLDYGKFDALRKAMYSQKVKLSLPRFRLEVGNDLSGPLKALGLAALFDPLTADLSGMSPAGGLFLDKLVQKAFIEVNEEGTEAAAVTRMGASLTGGPVSFIANRPFLFFIQENYSGNILFMGRVMDPSN